MTEFDENELENELTKNVKDKDTWLRFVYLVVFGVAFYLATLLIFAISVFQFLSKLFGAHPCASLSSFGLNLAAYLAEVTLFLTFSSDEKPFPFAPFPTEEDLCEETDEDESEPEEG